MPSPPASAFPPVISKGGRPGRSRRSDSWDSLSACDDPPAEGDSHVRIPKKRRHRRWRSSPLSLGAFILANWATIKEVRVMSSPPSPMDDAIAFPTLNEAELAALETLGRRRSVAVDEYLYREGDTTYDFYAIRSGAVEIVVRTEGEDQIIVRHGPGNFLGELNLLTGQRVFVSARV